MRVYIASPYVPKEGTLHDASRITAQRVSRSITIANKLIELGHMPHVPILSHYIHTHDSCKRDYGNWWYEYDLTYLEHWAEALFVVEINGSKGVKMEIEKANQLRLPIFFNFEDLKFYDEWGHIRKF
jgi:hypothetical protein